jgi:DNA-binding beta-propeller fold protein YncE
MDRREFVLAALAAPVALRTPRPMALVTADQEAHLAVVDLDSGIVVRRVRTQHDPRSIERVGAFAVVAHTIAGAVTILSGTEILHVLHDFEEPRYTAGDGGYAFVTDSGRADVATIDLARGRVVARLELGQWPRHLALSRDRRSIWISLGTASREVAIVDVSDPRRPHLRTKLRSPVLAHDVGFAPSGRVWVTSGAQRSLAIYHGSRVRVLAADEPPQHVTFSGTQAFVTSGAAGTLRMYDERTANLLGNARLPVGSYNVQAGAGRVITPSLARGTLSVAAGGRIRSSRVARSCHDACLA